jgi:ribosomal protein S18 acetylase RimI-like enzyme
LAHWWCPSDEEFLLMTERSARPARLADLDRFAEVVADYGFLIERWMRQQNDQGVLFVGWLGARPAGAVYLWLEDAEEPPIRRHLPRVALITHLEVTRELRNRGVGRTLVAVAEQHLRERGHEQVALAVRTDNAGAARLYRRLGYRYWDHGLVTCYARTTLPDGSVLEEPELCYVLVKDLVPVTPAPRAEARPIGAANPC